MRKTNDVFVEPGDRLRVERQAADVRHPRLLIGPLMDDVRLFFMDRTDTEVAGLLRGLADELDPQDDLREAIARKCEAWDWVREHAAEAVTVEVLRREMAG